METKNFLITGFGRSGTKFLQTMMNKSTKWDVKHEPRGVADENNPTSIYLQKHLQFIFDTEYYGEVNSYMRFHYADLKVDKKGLLIRNPLDIFLSVMNRKNYISEYKRFVTELKYWYNKFEAEMYSEKVKLISFEKMTTEVDYLNEIIKYFGIQDVNITEKDIQKINPNKTKKFNNFTDLPPQVQIHAHQNLKQYEQFINSI